jgi:Cys-tRNA(Pro) deacylase
VTRSAHEPVAPHAVAPPAVPTRVIAALHRHRIPFRLVPRPPGRFRCADVAAAAGIPVGAVMKTIVARLTTRRFVLVLLPGDRIVSFPKLARLCDVHHAAMATPAEAVALTGFEVGGITPLGCRTPDLPIMADASVLRWGVVNVGGGRADLGIELDAAALLRACAARLADLVVRSASPPDGGGAP